MYLRFKEVFALAALRSASWENADRQEIRVPDLIGKRDRAVIAAMIYTSPRVWSHRWNDC